jgi:phage shock protein A
MSVWKRLFTAVKGGVNDAAEGIEATQTLRILDQEIRESRTELRRSEEALTTILARQKMSQQKVQDLQGAVKEHEGYAIKALEQGNEDLAREVAEKIQQLEAELDTEQGFLDQFGSSASKLRSGVKNARTNLRRMQQQVDTVKATESVQKAQTAVASRHLGANSKMKTAAESLERIKAKQRLRQAELETAQELAQDESGAGLESKLKAAGITPGGSGSADDILARLKNR